MNLTHVITLSIPSPSSGVWDLGPLPIRGYALSIILGIVAAIWISERRWVALRMVVWNCEPTSLG